MTHKQNIPRGVLLYVSLLFKRVSWSENDQWYKTYLTGEFLLGVMNGHAPPDFFTIESINIIRNEGLPVPRKFITESITTYKLKLCSSPVMNDILADENLFKFWKQQIVGEVCTSVENVSIIDLNVASELYINNYLELLEMNVYSKLQNVECLFRETHPMFNNLMVYLFCRSFAKYRFSDARYVFNTNEEIRDKIVVSYLESDLPSVVVPNLIKHTETKDWSLLLDVIDHLANNHLRRNIVYEFQNIVQNDCRVRNRIDHALSDKEKEKFSDLLRW
jgi:hypothetical protein